MHAEGWKLWGRVLLQEQAAEMMGSSKCRHSSVFVEWLAMPATLRIQEQEHYELNRFHCRCIVLFFSSCR